MLSLDVLKDSKASLNNDFSAFRRAVQARERARGGGAPAAVAADHELQMSLATQRALSVAVRDAVRRAIRAAPRLLLLLRHHLSHVSNLRA